MSAHTAESVSAATRTATPRPLVERQRFRRKDALLVGLALLLDVRPALPDPLNYLGSALVAFPLYGIFWLLLRRPTQAFLFMWAVASISPVIGWVPRFGLFVALYVGACRWHPRVANAALVSCAVPLAIAAMHPAFSWTDGDVVVLRYDSVDYWRGPDPLLFPDVVLWIALTFATWKLGRLTYLADLRLQETKRLHAALSAQEVQAERLRLARELHDSVGHALSAIILQAAGVRTLVKGEDPLVPKCLAMIEETGVSAMRDVHAMLGLLRAEESNDGRDRPGGRLEDLSTLYDVARASGLAVVDEVIGSPHHLSEHAELAAYRVVQESLTNTRKHAGPGAQVRVVQDWKPDRLVLMVRNSEPPQPARESPTIDLSSLSSGTGLTGLAERLAMIGGRLEHGATDGGGFLVQADLPTASAQGTGTTS